MLSALRTWGVEARRSLVSHRKQPQITGEMALRMLADAAMLNLALGAALILRGYWVASVLGDAAANARLLGCVQAYLGSFWLLTPTCLIVLYRFGVYTRTRRYRGRYKALTIVQAVSLGYLIFGFELLLLTRAEFFPRSAIVIAWFLSLLALGGARLFVWIWTAFDREEHTAIAPVPDSRPLQNVLVIGGAGYIGSALTGRLLALGYNVRILDLIVYSDESIAEYYGNPRFELMRGDFCQIDSLVKAVQGMDAVVHLGAIVGDAACQLCEELTIEINLRATRTIAEVSKGYGVRRFIFASTCSVYGASDEILDERSALNPLSLYARTKVASERVLLDLADRYFAPTILRFGTIYGLSGRPRFDLVVNVLAAKAVQDGECGIVGGSQWRPLVHVKDVAEAIVRALQAPREAVCGEIFNVGSNAQNYQISELGRIIKEMVPSARVVSQASEDLRNYRVRFDKIARTLNFQPSYTVQDGVSEIVSALAEGRITDYRDPRYNNTNFLRQHDNLRRTVMQYVADCDPVLRLQMVPVAPVQAMPQEPAHSLPLPDTVMEPIR